MTIEWLLLLVALWIIAGLVGAWVRETRER
jgi:hypothetical protein